MVGMTSRERVIKAVERKEPDRTPIDFGGVVAGVVIGPPHGYGALCRQLGITDPETPVINTRLSSVQNVDERILRRFRVDTRHVNIGGEPLQELPDGRYRDAWGLILKQSGLYKSIPDNLAPLRDASTQDEIEGTSTGRTRGIPPSSSRRGRRPSACTNRRTSPYSRIPDTRAGSSTCTSG
jgi:hypothetical protein